MRKFLALSFALAAPLAAGPLTFDTTSQIVDVPFEATSTHVDFSFKNSSDKPVVIDRAQSDCPCITTAIKGGLVIAPGGTGTIRATMETKALTGTVVKPVMVWLKGDATYEPSQVLKMQANIPELVIVEPKAIIWEVGEKPAPKKVTVTMNHTTPIHVKSVTGADGKFTQEWKTIEEGKKYEISITPASTAGLSSGVIRLDTDCTYERHRSHGIFAVVKGKSQAAAVGEP